MNRLLYFIAKLVCDLRKSSTPDQELVSDNFYSRFL